MPTNESEHEPIVRACRRAATAKESPMTQKRLLELIEEEKKSYRDRQAKLAVNRSSK